MQIVLISGNVSSGKTSLSDDLRRQFGFEVLKNERINN